MQERDGERKRGREGGREGRRERERERESTMVLNGDNFVVDKQHVKVKLLP